MEKNKSRRNPSKKQNLMRDFCQWYEFWQAEDESKGDIAKGILEMVKFAKGILTIVSKQNMQN